MISSRNVAICSRASCSSCIKSVFSCTKFFIRCSDSNVCSCTIVFCRSASCWRSNVTSVSAAMVLAFADSWSSSNLVFIVSKLWYFVCISSNCACNDDFWWANSTHVWSAKRISVTNVLFLSHKFSAVVLVDIVEDGVNGVVAASLNERQRRNIEFGCVDAGVRRLDICGTLLFPTDGIDSTARCFRSWTNWFCASANFVSSWCILRKYISVSSKAILVELHRKVVKGDRWPFVLFSWPCLFGDDTDR